MPKMLGGKLDLMNHLFVNPRTPLLFERFMYLFELGHHLERQHSYITSSKKQSSFYIMNLHHMLTIYMILYSFVTGMTKWGNVLLILNDMTDIVLNLGRLLNELQFWHKLPTALTFVLLLITWGTFRIYTFFTEFSYICWI